MKRAFAATIVRVLRVDRWAVMKTFWLLLALSLAFFAGRTAAQEGSQDVALYHLVDCQLGKAVVVPGTEAPEIGLAVAWTLRPNRQQAPVDWSLLDHGENGVDDLFQKFPVDYAHLAQGDYLPVDGVLDLKSKVFTPLPSRAPYFLTKNHGSLEADWSDAVHGTRYGIIANDGGGHYFERTLELWLVQIDARGTRFVELTPAADQAVRAYLRKRDPKDAANYTWEYHFPDDSFQGRKLTVHFEAATALEHDTDDGVIRFALPQGTVISTTKQ